MTLNSGDYILLALTLVPYFLGISLISQRANILKKQYGQNVIADAQFFGLPMIIWFVVFFIFLILFFISPVIPIIMVCIGDIFIMYLISIEGKDTTKKKDHKVSKNILRLVSEKSPCFSVGMNRP